MRKWITLLPLLTIAATATLLLTQGASAQPAPHQAPLGFGADNANSNIPAQRITSEQAYAIMSANPADTQTAPGLTLRQATGLDPIPNWHPTGPPAPNTAPSAPPTTRRLATTAGQLVCWYGVTRSYTWGFFWPTSGTLTDHANSWCAHYQYSLTSWSHTVSQGGSYCSPAGTNKWISYYYNGSPIVKLTDWGNWNCSFGVNLGSSQREMELSYNSYGNDWIDWHN